MGKRESRHHCQGRAAGQKGSRKSPACWCERRQGRIDQRRNAGVTSTTVSVSRRVLQRTACSYLERRGRAVSRRIGRVSVHRRYFNAFVAPLLLTTAGGPSLAVSSPPLYGPLWPQGGSRMG